MITGLQEIHIVKNHFDTLPFPVLEELNQMLPCKGDLFDAKRWCYSRIVMLLSNHYKSVLPGQIFANCILHSDCRARCLLTKPFQRTISLESYDDEQEGMAVTLTTNAAGLVCTGVTRMGKQAADANDSMPSTLNWCYEWHCCQEAWVFTECGQDSSAEFIASKLPAPYKGFTCVVCPTDIGDCVCRKRRLTNYFNEEKVC